MADGGRSAANPTPAVIATVDDPSDVRQVELDHWRRMARQRAAALDALQRRPSVRAVIALDRRLKRLRRGRDGVQQVLSTGRSRLRLLVSALRARPGLAGSRRRLAAELASLSAPPRELRSVTIIVTPAPEPGREELMSAGIELEVVPVDAAGETAAAAVAAAFASARGELVCLIAASSRPLEDGWLGRLAAAMGGDVAASVPLLVHPARALTAATPHDLLVREEGLRLEAVDGTPRVVARHAGSAVDVRHAVETVDAGSSACFLIDRLAYERAGGFAPLNDLDAAVIDLCARLRRGGKQVVVVPGAVVEDGRPVGSASQLCSPVVDGSSAWRELVDASGPLLLRVPSPYDGLRVACSVASPGPKVAARWGDWHLAHALADSLARRGHQVRVQMAPESDDPAGRCCDVHLVLRGLTPVRRTPGQHHVLWIISHPESVETWECDEADLVLVASHRFAEALRQRTSTPVEVLLQATDHRRFRPLDPDPEHCHPVTVVAKTREVMRPIVADALAAGIRPAIYGGGWVDLVDRELVVAEHVPNEELPGIYASAGVVLNDHWETMRAWGFVSNRIFDVLACGVPVISDHLPEIADLFGDAVPTYRTPDDLRTQVREVLADPPAARRRAAGGRDLVLAAHTFDHRAEQLLDLLAHHLPSGGYGGSS